MTDQNVSDRFDRLPATGQERSDEGRPTRAEVLEWWEERFGIDPAVFEEHTFWEKGNGQCWAVAGDATDPIEIEALGMKFLRARQEHWKPTTNAVQRFGTSATKNVIALAPEEARVFARGGEQDLDWEGDWGYLIAAHEVAGEMTPLGVGLYTYGTLQSMVPTGRQRTLE
jgi:NOL1/NOP2/fmu family ribosome biogenesis protein